MSGSGWVNFVAPPIPTWSEAEVRLEWLKVAMALGMFDETVRHGLIDMQRLCDWYYDRALLGKEP